MGNMVRMGSGSNTTNDWCGIKGLTRIYHGDWADPEVKYKGISFSEYDIIEIADIDISEAIYTGLDIDPHLIGEGVLTEKSKGKSWDKDTGDIIDDWLTNPNNHETILCRLDDMIHAMQNEELYERLTSEATDLYQNNCDSVEFEFCVNAAELLNSYARQSKDQWEHLKDLTGDKEIPLPSIHGDYVGDYLFDYLVDLGDKKLNKICKTLELKPQKTYIINAQNGEYEECFDESQVIECFEKLTGKYEGLAAVIVSVDGTEFKDVLNTNSLKELKEMFGIKEKEPKSIEKE